MRKTDIELRTAFVHELEDVCGLYESAKEEPFCSWNEFYPTKYDALRDLESGGLYVLSDGENIFGAISVVPENEMDSFDGWTYTAYPREIARVVTAQSHRCHGFATFMVKELMSILSSNGVTAIRLSVRNGSLPALRIYEKCGFENIGEANMYGGDYFLFEKML